MNIKFVNFLFLNLIVFNYAYGQVKQDYQWIMGYDQAADPKIINLDFNFCNNSISQASTIDGFWMEGSNTSMSDTNGNLLFYSNGCYIINKAGEVMDNGEGINPGLIEDIYCPAGGSPYIQGVISIPAPGSDSLYYIFNLDMDLPYFMVPNFLGVAPERLYYQVIDMTEYNGLGKVISKNQIAIQDTFARGCLKAVRHANGVDWWIIVPKSHSYCYFLTLVTTQGVQPAVLKCEGKIWGDLDLTQSVFSPDGTKYIRCNKENGLNIFDFNNETGDLSNPLVIDLPNDTFYNGGVSVSSNSRFLYLSARKKLYQFDLHTDDIAASQILIGEWDGFSDPYPTIFYISALAPDNKIYISSTSSHRFLHVIHQPDSLGLACNLEQRGLALPSNNFATIPNFPHYRSQANDCDTMASNSKDPILTNTLRLFPNPAKNHITIQTGLNNLLSSIYFEVYNLIGQKIKVEEIQNGVPIDITDINTGIYYYIVRSKNCTASGKLIKTE
jgi:hypothetical protein